MNSQRQKIVFLGLSLSSSWGNGHATTYRALIQGLAELGHEILFLERDVPWYAAHRDLGNPGYCRLELYTDLDDLLRHRRAIADADAVIVGSYVPEGVSVARYVLETAHGVVGFYDIDTPVTVAKLDRGDHEYLTPDLVLAFDVYLSFTSGPILDRLRQEYGARLAVPLHCMVDPVRYAPTGEPVQWDLGYLGTYSGDRQPGLERLLIEPARQLPELRFVVAGPQYPADIDWPANVERLDHVAPEHHPGFYSRLRYALNLTRADMIAAGWSPSVRLFEAAACGTPIVSDRWEGIGSFFPEGEAIAVADETEDVVDILKNFTAVRAEFMAQTARRLVLSGHTGRKRAEELGRALQVACKNKKPNASLKEPHHVVSASA